VRNDAIANPPSLLAKDAANPSARSNTMMFRDTFGPAVEAAWIESSLTHVLGAGYRTEDLAEAGTKTVSTSTFLDILHQGMQRTFKNAEKYG
jgi:3-isopropylmalate dehydrogenase